MAHEFRSQDGLPARAVGYDPAAPVRTSPPPAADQSGITSLAEDRPVLEDSDADSADVGGGAEMTITGNDLAGVTEVFFGETPAASFELVSNEELTCVIPEYSDEETPIDVDLTVVSAAGRSNALTFTFTSG